MNCISAIRPMAADLALNHGLEKNVAASSGVVQHFRPEDAISCNDGNVVGRHTVIDDAAPLVVPRVDTAATEFEGLFRNLRPTCSALFLCENFPPLSSRSRPAVGQLEVTR
ncbi:hypothetical protein FHT86_004368 [Rhizobium sp. BK313]|nr:hypothetical protein [Rhizobium sp. BK313]